MDQNADRRAPRRATDIKPSVPPGEPPPVDTEMIGLALKWGTLAFGLLTFATVAMGDPIKARASLMGIWAAGALFCHLLSESGRVVAGRAVLVSAVWASFAAAHWLHGPLPLQIDPWQVMAILVSAVLGGRVLALAMGAASLSSIAGLWWMQTAGLAPIPTLGRTMEAIAADDVGLMAFVVLGSAGLVFRLVRIADSERRQSALAADSAEKFKALFLDSPTPMALVEVDRRASPEPYTPPDKRKRGTSAPRLLAFNGAFGETFESSLGQAPGSVAELWRYQEDFWEVERKVMRGGVVKGAKANLVSWRNKRKMVCLASASMSQWEGARAVLWSFQDVTEIELLRHRLERQNQALAGKLESTAIEARFDALTLLPNRRALEERIALADGPAREGSLCAFMVDVDCFKKYNDSLGHPEGDKCLAKIGEALAMAASEWGDRAFAARYGGEEFSVLLMNATPKEATRMGQSICDSVSSLNMPHPSNTAGPIVTVSVGGSMRLEGGSTMDALKRADEALYQSKTQGRNQARVDPPEVPR